MKATVIETGEEIEVYQLWTAPFCRLDCNGKIAEEYDIDELEFEPQPKRVSLDAICEWLKTNAYDYTRLEYLPDSDYPQADFDVCKMVKDLRDDMLTEYENL